MILLHSQINFNMGCIETIIVCKLYICLFGLTLTWDVLKLSDGLLNSMIFCSINFNMGCIETK